MHPTQPEKKSRGEILAEAGLENAHLTMILGFQCDIVDCARVEPSNDKVGLP